MYKLNTITRSYFSCVVEGPPGLGSTSLHMFPLVSGKSIYRICDFPSINRRGFFLLRARYGDGGGGGCELGEGEGWPGRGGWWGKWLPVRSSAAGVVEGSGRALEFWVAWAYMATGPREGSEGGGSPTVVADRKEGRCRSVVGRVGPDPRWAVAGGGGEEKAARHGSELG